MADAKKVDLVVGCAPALPMHTLLDDEHLQPMIHALRVADVTEGGARRLAHHALSDEMAYGGGIDFSKVLSGARKLFGAAKVVEPHVAAAYRALKDEGLLGGFSLGQIWHALRSGAKKLHKSAMAAFKKAAPVVARGIDAVVANKDTISNVLGSLPTKHAAKVQRTFDRHVSHAADLGSLLSKIEERTPRAAKHEEEPPFAENHREIAQELAADLDPPPSYSSLEPSGSGVQRRRR